MIESILHRDVGSTEIVVIAIAAVSGKHKEVEAEAARVSNHKIPPVPRPFPSRCDRQLGAAAGLQ